MRLAGDPDWQIVFEAFEARYETLKESLVTVGGAEQEVLRGRAQEMRALLADIRTARQRLENLENGKRASRPFADL